MRSTSGGASKDDAPVRQVVGEVVVGYDGSPASVAALRWAATEAGSRWAPLRVLCVADLGRHGDPGALGPDTLPTVQRLFREEQEAAQRLVEEGAAIVAQVDGGPPDERVSAQAVLDSATVALIKASGTAALLVLGHRGRSALVTALLGSVAFSVTAAAACPVVVVRGHDRPAADRARSVVLGVDIGAACGQADSPALSLAAATAQRCGAPLTVLADVEADTSALAQGASWRRTTATGQSASWSTAWLTDPRKRDPSAPRPRAPTTTSPASLEASARARAGRSWTTLVTPWSRGWFERASPTATSALMLALLRAHSTSGATSTAP